MTSRNYTYLIAILVILICAIAIRSIHIDADTPGGLSWSAGLYVDEGYKTLAPRNLILYGSTHWHTADTYPGWMKSSPVTQWSTYAAFKSFGVNLSSARLVPIVYFTLLIILCSFFMYRRYSLKLLYIGLALLATDITLFTFSRVALFEVPISFFLYTMLLPLSRFDYDKKSPVLPIAWLFIGGLVLAFTIKLSVLIYIFPILAAASILFIKNNNKITKKQIAVLSSVLSLGIFLTLAFSYNTWSERVGISPQKYIYSIIESPLLITSPLIIIAGTICAAHAITYQFSQYFNNLYRLSLIFMVISAPLLLSLFPYSPLRYYMPFVPAYILLIIEWFSTTPTKPSNQTVNYALYATSMLMLGLAIMYIFTALKLNEYIQMRFLIVIGSGVVLILWSLRRLLFSDHIVRLTVTGLLVLSVLHNIYFIGSFISNPSYNANAMRDRLSDVVNEGEIISGGWAPFLALGTPIKALYANTMFNPPSALKEIKPDYFILSNTPTALEAFKILSDDEKIIVGDPVELGTYNKTRVQIYPLSYSESK